MDQFHASGFRPHTMQTINKYRMYLHIITVDDITNPHGIHIYNNILKGIQSKRSHVQRPRSTTLHNTTPRDWAVWRISIQWSLMIHATTLQSPIDIRTCHHYHQNTRLQYDTLTSRPYLHNAIFVPYLT